MRHIKIPKNMAKFIKPSSIEFNHKQNENTALKESNQEDVSSPLYFPPPEDQLRQKEVAQMFGRTVQTICAWTENGVIPHFRVGKFPIYSRKQLILYASKNQNLINSNK